MLMRIAHHIKTISTNAAPGERKRKNRPDHATLSSSCSKNNLIGTAVIPTCRQTSHAANAIARYKSVQTGPNSQFGGVHLGFFNSTYQFLNAGTVKNEP